MNKTHGMCNTQTYRSWLHMIQRCYNPHRGRFKDYGGRGIQVCARWHDFQNFIADLGPRPPGMTLNRIDNDSDYCPDNCNWATAKQQNNNCRKRHTTLYVQRMMPEIKALRTLGMSYEHIARRIGVCNKTIRTHLKSAST
jgi:hypothetical protein